MTAVVGNFEYATLVKIQSTIFTFQTLKKIKDEFFIVNCFREHTIKGEVYFPKTRQIIILPFW